MSATYATTRDGRTIVIISVHDLLAPMENGRRKLRALCHLHGGDHQRSLSIDRQTGWGRCFNATCQACVLVQEFNPEVAERLLHNTLQHAPPAPRSMSVPPSEPADPSPPMSVPPVREVSDWQQEERAALLAIHNLLPQALSSYKLGDSWQAQAYLEERGIEMDVALRAGVGYLPREFLEGTNLAPYRLVLQRWCDRLLFPLHSPEGNGYLGRSLWHWQLGMDELVHKALLEEPGAPSRWLKTRPAGWYGNGSMHLFEMLVLVEGAFDKLTLLNGGFSVDEVLALAGTTLDVTWLSPQVRAVLVAFDADDAGLDASLRIAERLHQTGRIVALCPPPQDGSGKDWNERWRRIGSIGIDPLCEAYAHLGTLL